MDPVTRALVRDRAGNRCEHCKLLQAHSELPHHIEHIIPRQHSASHGGSDLSGNLALACQRCNLNKGPNLTGIDPLTRGIVQLFDPVRVNKNETVGVEV